MMSGSGWSFVVGLTLVVWQFGSAHGNDGTLLLNNTGPAVLDIPIFFFAELTDFEDGEYLSWHWSDDMGHKFTQYGGGPKVSWNISYDSFKYPDYTESVTVTLEVEKKYAVIWLSRASASTSFELSGELRGELTFKQPNVTLPKHGFISTASQTNLTVALHDFNDWLKQHTEVISFFWNINDDDGHARCSTPSLVINITEPGVYSISATVILDLSDHVITTTTTSTTTTTTTTTTPKPNTTTATPKTTTTTTVRPTPSPRTWYCDGYWPQIGYVDGNSFGKLHKLGYFHTKIKAVEPIGHVNVTGNKWLKHGDLVDLSVECSGSPTIGYCIQKHSGVYNVTGRESCGEDVIMTTTCKFTIVSYFQQNGTHTIVIIMLNDISKVVYPIAINIYNVDRKPQLSYIIIPVSCSLVVIIIIVFGISYFIQSRNRYSVEVADFDFGASEEIEYKTMFEQLKESLRQAFSGQDREAEEDAKWRRRSHMVERPRILEEED